jgi:hypothetical protein
LDRASTLTLPVKSSKKLRRKSQTSPKAPISSRTLARLTRNLSALKSDGGDNKRSDGKNNDIKDQNAGNAFGGKNSMKK